MKTIVYKGDNQVFELDYRLIVDDYTVTIQDVKYNVEEYIYNSYTNTNIVTISDFEQNYAL